MNKLLLMFYSRLSKMFQTKDSTGTSIFDDGVKISFRKHYLKLLLDPNFLVIHDSTPYTIRLKILNIVYKHLHMFIKMNYTDVDEELQAVEDLVVNINNFRGQTFDKEMNVDRSFYDYLDSIQHKGKFVFESVYFRDDAPKKIGGYLQPVGPPPAGSTQQQINDWPFQVANAIYAKWGDRTIRGSKRRISSRSTPTGA